MTSLGSLNLFLGADTSALQTALKASTNLARQAGGAIGGAFGSAGSQISSTGGQLQALTGNLLGVQKASNSLNLSFSALSLPFSSELSTINALTGGISSAKSAVRVFNAALGEASQQSGAFGQSGSQAFSVWQRLGSQVVGTIRTLDSVLQSVIDQLARSNIFFGALVTSAKALGIPLSLTGALLDDADGAANRLNQSMADTTKEAIATASQLANIADFLITYSAAIGTIAQVATFNPAESLLQITEIDPGPVIAGFQSIVATTKLAEYGIATFLDLLGDFKPALLDIAGQAIAPFKQQLISAGVPVDKLSVAFGKLKNTAFELNDVFEKFQEFNAYIGIFKQLGGVLESVFGSDLDVFNVAKDFQALKNQLQVVAPEGQTATESLQQLRNQTNDLGLAFKETASSFVKFTAAARGTALEGEAAQGIFEGVSRAASVMQLTTADTEGVFLALSQIISKGTVSAEELRGQLGERLPGAFQIAARSIGVTTAELDKLLQTGALTAEDFLPRFAEQLSSEFAGGIEASSQSATAAVNRFQNSLLALQQRSGEFVLPIAVPAINALAQAMNFLATDVGDRLFQLVDAVLVQAILFKLVPAVVAATKVFFGITASVTSLSQAIPLVRAKMLEVAATAGKIAAQFVLAYAATEAFFRILDRLADGAANTRTSIASLDRSISELQAVKVSESPLKDLLPEKPPPTDWIDALVVKYNELNTIINKTGNAINTALGFSFLKVDENFLNFRTNSEKQLDDLLVAIGDFSSRSQEILGNSLRIRGEAKAGGGIINELKNVDALLQQIEERKLSIDPSDAEAVAALRAEEDALLKRRIAAQKEITAQQAATNNALNQAKQQLQELDPAKLGTEGYARAKQAIETQINLIEKEKTAFDELAKSSVATQETIAASFADTNQQIELGYANRQAQIAQAVASGLATEEDARQQNLQAEQEYLQQKLKLNQDELAKLQAELSNAARLRAIDPSSATLTPDQEKQITERVKQLELENAQTRLGLARSVTDGKRELLGQELDDIKEANEQATALIERSQNDRIAAIRQAQLTGGVSEDDAQRQIEGIRREGISREIELEQTKLAQIQELAASGVLSREQAAKEESSILGNLSRLNLQRIEAEIEAREAANRQILDDFERSNSLAQAAIERSQTERIAAIREAQLAGTKSEEDAQREIAAIQQDATAQAIALKEEELTQVRQLRQQGVLTAEEAADRELQLQQEIGQVNLQRIEAELQAQRELASQRIEAQYAARDLALESRAGTLNLETDLLQAQLSLQESLNTLANEQLETQIQQAEATGNSALAEQLRLQQQQLQTQQSEQQYQLQLEQLQLQQEIKQIELERQLIQAEIALAQAEAEGATARELESRRQLVALAERQLANQQRVNDLERQNLNAQRAISQERSRREQSQQRISSGSGGIGGSDRSSGSGGGFGGSGGGGGGSTQSFSRILTSSVMESQAAADAAISRAFQSAGDPRANLLQEASTGLGQNTDFLRKLDQSGLGNLGDLAARLSARSEQEVGFTAKIGSAIAQARLSNTDVVEALDRLAESNNRMASSPRSLTVSTPDPIRDTGRILSDVSRQGIRASGL